MLASLRAKKQLDKKNIVVSEQGLIYSYFSDKEDVHKDMRNYKNMKTKKAKEEKRAVKVEWRATRGMRGRKINCLSIGRAFPPHANQVTLKGQT